MKLLITATSLLPSYGGPAYSVSSLAEALAARGAQVGLWAADGSAVTTTLRRDGSRVERLVGPLVAAVESFGRPRVVHDNGIWLPHHHRIAELARSQGIPRVVSLRGTLEPWAMAHKRWKKVLAWPAYQRRDLTRARMHHATAETEAANIRAHGLGVTVRVIANGLDLPASVEPGTEREGAQRFGAGGRRVALFLGRIYPVKGLPLLIEAWRQVAPEGWELRIAGPDEAGHKAEIEARIAAAGLGDVVRFLGPLEGAVKSAAYREADIFVLPTHSENFGMAIAEALAHEVPVLTTKGAPWPMLEEQRCGWWVPVSVEGLAEGLRRAVASPEGERRDMGARGRRMVEDLCGWSRVAAEFEAMYEASLT